MGTWTDVAKEVSSLLEENSFEEIDVKKDYAGLDRVVCGCYRGE